MKELALKILKAIALVNAFGQLALSQLHIEAITKIFIKEIGFYLFFFIIFCLLTGFNTFLLENRRGIVFLVLTNWLTATTAFIYLQMLQTDVANQEVLTLADVQVSWMLTIAAITICLINSIAIPVLSWRRIKTS